MANLVFTCPTTNWKVQHWLDDDEDATDNEYEAITCQACARLHLINRKTQHLLGQMDSPQVGAIDRLSDRTPQRRKPMIAPRNVRSGVA
jgi:hypothetical protein